MRLDSAIDGLFNGQPGIGIWAKFKKTIGCDSVFEINGLEYRLMNTFEFKYSDRADLRAIGLRLGDTPIYVSRAVFSQISF